MNTNLTEKMYHILCKTTMIIILSEFGSNWKQFLYTSTECYFSKKEGSRMHRVTQNVVGDGFGCTDTRKRRFRNVVPGCVLLRKNFWNDIASEKYPWVY